MRIYLLLFCISFAASLGNAQTCNDFFVAKKNWDTDFFASQKACTENELNRRLANSLSNYYRLGAFTLNQESCDSILAKTETLSSSSKLLLAPHYAKWQKDSIELSLLLSSLNESIERNDTLLINEALLQINEKLMNNEKNHKSRKRYIELAKSYRQDSTDHANYLFYESIRYSKQKKEENQIDLEYAENMIKEGLSLSTSAYQKASLHNFLGTFYSFLLEEEDRANTHYDHAIELLKGNDSYHYQNRLNSIELNKAVNLFHESKYDQAIEQIHQTSQHHEKRDYHMLNYLWLSRAFEKKEQHDSAYFYFKKAVALKDSLNREGVVTKIQGIEHDYEIKAKEKELHQLSKEKSNLLGQLSVLLPLALLLTLVSIVIYYKYIKTSKEKIFLESEVENTTHQKQELEKSYQEILAKEQDLRKEKQNTLKELENLKQVATKDFITLQDKTKVYVEELMYIQSDDHYLKVHLHEKKDNFVRGKLSQLLKELPPNFKRSHRSYIVNENYIRKINTNTITMMDEAEVPMSKTYKNQFLNS